MTSKNPATVVTTATIGFNPLLAIVHAIGTNATSGYTTSLRTSPNRIRPPQVELVNELAGEIVTEVITPFSTNELHHPIEDGQTHVSVVMPEGGIVDVLIT